MTLERTSPEQIACKAQQLVFHLTAISVDRQWGKVQRDKHVRLVGSVIRLYTPCETGSVA